MIFFYCKKKWYNIFIKHLFIVICFTLFSQDGFTDQFAYGPRFEIGIGPSVSRMQSQPEWSSKFYASTVMNFSYRIVYGLSVQLGKNFSYGLAPRPEWINYGPHYQINTDMGTYYNATWIGARYDIPINKLNKDIHGIHTFYFAMGATNDEYSIRSGRQRYYIEEYGWESVGKFEEESLVHSYKTADLSGYYVALAARWRLDTEFTEEKGSWIGAYGLDIGIRYTRYPNFDTKYDNIM
ncbi:MAG TPA: hypothetical protein ENH82_17345, partial [bacterium]|nr:hypothetical protein [bacterium]